MEINRDDGILHFVRSSAVQDTELGPKQKANRVITEQAIEVL